MSTSLTSEQQRRIEENKKRAKERLARKRPPPSLPPATQPFSVHPKTPRGLAPSEPPPHPGRTQTSSQAFGKWRPGVAPAKDARSQTKRKCLLTLLSKTRFRAVTSYDSALIDLFKKIPSKSYDASSYTWSFAIEHHHELVKSIQANLPHIQLDCIPKPVVSLFVLKSGQHGREKMALSRTVPLTIDLSSVDDKLVSTLMKFQRRGVEFCVEREGRALIADDMGLGKTLQAICVACYYRKEWPVLVVCPASVKTMWAEAFKCWVPSLDPARINVVATTRSSTLGSSASSVNIISYDLLVKKRTEIEERPPQFVIADESHFLKNYSTKRARATLPLIRKARRALLMSGTPALSRPIELFTQISALDKNFRMKLTEFGLRYCNGIKNRFGWDFSGESNMHELSIYLEERIMIRRMKVDVLDELPSKRRQMVILDMPMLNSRNQEWNELKQQLEKVTTITKAVDQKSALLPLFGKSGVLKIPAVSGYILDLLEGRRKLLVFAHHRRMMDAICDSLERKGHGYIRIDGNTPTDVRQSRCDLFQHNQTCVVAVLSITAASTGLTLTAASVVVFAELFWNPGVLIQAEDRAYRIGQKDSVNIHYLIAQGTADDFIWPLVQSKLEVLTKAGLAGEDFSKADSTTVTRHNPHHLKQSTIEALFATVAEDGPSVCTLEEAELSAASVTTAAASSDKDGCHAATKGRDQNSRGTGELVDDGNGSSEEAASEGEEGAWNLGNCSAEEVSWLDAINLEDLEEDDFCIA